MNQIKLFIKYNFVLYAIIALVYWIFIRQMHQNWGATPAEMIMKLPGDELISSKRIISTRAINIHARKEKVWPWIAQTGQNRGGFNSYFWLENLFGARMLNADTVNPAWQNPQPGDTVYYGKNQGYALVSLAERNKFYSLGGWTFYLQSVNDNNTRLLVRYPSMEVGQNKFAALCYYGLFEPLHFIMESGMMMGIKKRAEKK